MVLSSTSLSAVVVVSAVVCCAGFLVFVYIYSRFLSTGRRDGATGDNKDAYVYDRESKSVIKDKATVDSQSSSSEGTGAEEGARVSKPFETVNPFAGTNLFKMQKDRSGNNNNSNNTGASSIPLRIPMSSPTFDSANPNLMLSDAYNGSKGGLSLNNPMTRPDVSRTSVSARVRMSALSPGKRPLGSLTGNSVSSHVAPGSSNDNNNNDGFESTLL